MGYFSNFAIDEDICHHDVSITSPEQQLLWRLDDLRERLDELKISGPLGLWFQPWYSLRRRFLQKNN